MRSKLKLIFQNHVSLSSSLILSGRKSKVSSLLSIQSLKSSRHTDLSRCVQCRIGQTSAIQGAASCSSCDLGKFGSAPGVCDPCPAEKYQDDKGQLACKTCRSGKVVNSQQTACETPGE